MVADVAPKDKLGETATVNTFELFKIKALLSPLDCWPRWVVTDQ